jgi:hypothetical protein
VRRLAPGFEIAQFVAERARVPGQLFDLLLVELDLLLPAPDLELTRVRLLPRRRGAGFGFGEREPDAFQGGFERGHVHRRGGLAVARVGEPRLGGVDVARQRRMAVRELDLLPAAELLAQALVAARPRRLSLQRVALLLDLEDDVVDPRQVLLRRLELQLGGAPARLVLRHPRGFFDQHPPFGRPRRQDLADLPLLDDRVRLDAEAGVHEQIVDVTQAADLSVDQVFALARSIQPAADLHVARDQRLIVEEEVGRRIGRRRRHGNLRDVGELETHLGRRRRLARVAAVEDHVFHAIAAQALGALLAEHPGDRVDDVALAAAVRADDGGDAVVEAELGAIAEALEAADVEFR